MTKYVQMLFEYVALILLFLGAIHLLIFFLYNINF